MVWLRIDYNGHGFDAFVTDAIIKWGMVVTLAGAASFFFRDLCCQGDDALGPRSWGAAGAAWIIAASVCSAIVGVAQHLPLVWVWLPYGCAFALWQAMPSFTLVAHKRPRALTEAQEDWS